jgi:hypothetical protein
MKQYEYEATHKTRGNIERIRATAASADIARAQIVLAYGQQFAISELFCDVNAPHQIVGEINCSDFPPSDFAWLMREAQLLERITSI